MRINWFSPLPPARSDVANYSLRVLPCLSRKGIAVKVWASNADYSAEDWPAGIRVADGSAQRLPWPEINFRDVTVYQVGNDLRYHGSILSHAERHGGIIVLHDLNLHEIQRMRYVVESHQPGRYLALLAEAGGDEAAGLGRAHLSGEQALAPLVERFPLTASVLRGAHGVVVHNPAALETVRALTPAPVIALPLPYEEAEQLPPLRRRTWNGSRRIRLVMFGFIHSANRRLPEILSILAQEEFRDLVELDLFGELSLDFDLPGALASHGLRERVRFHGFLNEEEMSEILDAADLALNLRSPSMGESSGALLRMWSHRLCAVVSDTGIYRTLPDSCVVRIPADPAEEGQALGELLRAAARDPRPFYERGEAARRLLEQEHGPARYADRLTGFIEQTRAYRPRAYLERYLPRLSHGTIGNLPARRAQNYWIDRIAGIFADGLGPASR